MNLRFVETFLWTARLGSFSAAAERLNATQASISNRISTLEEELGVQLFERVFGGVKLTEIGHNAIPKAQDLMKAASIFRQAISDPLKLEGTIRIGTNDIVVHSFLPRLIERIQQHYPGISIDLDVDISSVIAEKVINRKIDFAIIINPINLKGFTNIDLGRHSCVWIANPKLGLGGKALKLADITDHRILTFAKETIPYQWLLHYFEKDGFTHPSISNFNSLASLLKLTIEGLGVTALPRNVLEEYLENGKLEILNITPAFPPFTCYAVYPDYSDSPLVSIIAELATDVASSYADK